jgi:translation elongation factor P/translation initiation factor 5A
MDGPVKIAKMIRADELTKSQFVVISGRPCRITSTTFNPSSHNAPTVHIIGTDITTTLKPRSFVQQHQQTCSLYSSPKALVPVPEVTSMRGDRLQVGDYVRNRDILGHITHLQVTKAGLRQKIYIFAKEILTGNITKGIVWDDQMVEMPTLNRTELRLLGFLEPQIIEVEDPNSPLARVGCKELAKQIEQFWQQGRREVWVGILIGGVVGAYEVSELEVKAVEPEGFLALKGEGGVPDRAVKKPLGRNGDKIADFLERGKRFSVKIKADMGEEEQQDAWTVQDVRAL